MKIVLVTGGFDPLHSGHIAYFKAARKLGDMLIVGLNSDDWLTRKKGRPFMKWNDRAGIIYNLKMVAEVRAGINTRNAAVSGDGRYVMMANYLPHTLVLLDARDLAPLKVIDVNDGKNKSSRVSAVYDAASRHSFVAALKDIPEVWEISYDEKAEPIPVGMVHDFQYKEGAFVPGKFNPRRSVLGEYLDDFFFTPDYSELMATSRDGGAAQVVNLNVRRKIASVELGGMPHLASGITWTYQGRTVLATPNLKQGLVSVIDVKSWQKVKEIPTNGPGFFMRSHENTPYAWGDAFMSAKKDTLQEVITLMKRSVTDVPLQFRNFRD